MVLRLGNLLGVFRTGGAIVRHGGTIGVDSVHLLGRWTEEGSFETLDGDLVLLELPGEEGRVSMAHLRMSWSEVDNGPSWVCPRS